ncbi:MAG: NAD+ synthase [Thermoplasmata archaeon]
MSADLVPRLPAHAEETIGSFVRSHSLYHGNEGVVLGLSGGIDSALVARIARDAVGAPKVLAVLMPDEGLDPDLVRETERFAASLGIASRTVPIAPIEGAFRASLPEVADRVTVGNTKSRIRMSILYALARERRRVVVGTGNKSELLLGYFTKFGDGAVDLLPIGDLYKTQVREIAERLGLPAQIRDRAPSAGFWEGQTDEEELGVPYAEIDRVLYGHELGLSEEEIARRAGVGPEIVRGLIARVLQYRHKRRSPPVAKVGARTIGIDWKD